MAAGLKNRLWVALGVAACGASLAHAADPVKNYPLRPLRLVSAFAAGGNSDTVGRLLAPKLAERLGQNVIVENRPGAGSMIGTAYVANATPDGHTILVMSGAFTSQAAVMKTLPFEPLRDFDWISLVVVYPFVVVVNTGSPIHTVSDLVVAAKRNPKKLNYGSVGIGSVFHLAAELFNSMAGTDILHVPYRGSTEPTTELIAARLDVIFNTLTGAHPHIQAKRLRAIAVASLERSPQLPNVPTVGETLPGYEVTSFVALAAPRGTPRAVIARLNREVRAVLDQPDIRQRFINMGGTAQPSTPGEMGRHLEAEIAKWKRIVAEKKIELQ
ncbi:MAG: tripartite tricarboxylate transporter substrate binding protein [Betaproteobacteria bacterium]|nr:tripartite tricarboxylate transporter substrate binding protein [Betaproteobacteria bacterium]